MGGRLRVLMIEDSEDDALLMEDELCEGGYDVVSKRVASRDEMAEAIRSDAWDLIIADYTLPRFSGPSALQILRDSGLDIPMILVSGTVSTETAVEMMRAGAKDYIEKKDLRRLVPVVARELHEARVREERKWAQEHLLENEEKYHQLFSTEPDAIMLIDVETLGILEANDSALRLYGYDERVLLAMRYTDLSTEPEETRRRIQSGRGILRVSALRHRKRDGTTFPAEASDGFFTMHGRRLVWIAVRDITERLKAEEQRREFYKRTIFAATGGKLAITEGDEIERLAGQPMAVWQIEKPVDLGRIRAEMTDKAAALGMDEYSVQNLLTCVGEAAANALKHAGGGTASLHEIPNALMVVVSDRGPGIDALNIPSVALVPGYSTAGTLGMGYKMMLASSDHVRLATGPDGTTVGFVVRLHSEDEAPLIPSATVGT